MRAATSALLGLVLIAGGIVLILFGNRALDDHTERLDAALARTVVFSSQDARYDQFLRSPSFGIEMDAAKFTHFYLFNITNAQQMLHGDTPRVQQLGPYVYKRSTRKVNVQFITQSDGTNLLPKRQVRYQVQAIYSFVPERSNGSEYDQIISINGSYARRLYQLQKVGLAERFLASEFAQTVVAKYSTHLNGEFLAQFKQRALGHSLPQTFKRVLQRDLQQVLKSQQKRVDSSQLTANLVQMFALTRVNMVPQVLTDIYKDISDRFMPDIMTKALQKATTSALPRMLSNTHDRLLVESGSFLLRHQFLHQKRQHVPITLGSLKRNLARIAFPYALKEVYDFACLEVVPSYLLTLKLEIIQQDMTTNLVLADVAQHNVVTRWRKGRIKMDFDAFVDDQPLGVARTGFELYPTLQSQELSEEVAYLLLGSAANKRFSIVDYPEIGDGTFAKSHNFDGAVPLGFALWKQVIAMNETAISLLITGVNNDVALKTDFLTRTQVLFVRQYLISWAQSDLVQRDRERYWRQGGFTLRSVHSQTEPFVDLDFELAGVQTGFELGTKVSGISSASAMILWNSSHAFSFLNVDKGFPLWVLASQGDANTITQIQTGVTGLTKPQTEVIASWISGLLANAFLWRRALRQWSDGNCASVLQLPMTSCIQYDLEPVISAQQTGFEMNTEGNPSIQLSKSSREYMWDATNAFSFLNTQGYAAWLSAAKNTESFTALVTSLKQSSPTALALENSVTLGATVNVILQWLMAWRDNPLNALATTQWWHQSWCREREVQSTGTPVDTTTSNKATCTPQTIETVLSTTPLETKSMSPYFKDDKTIEIRQITCTLDPTSQLYTQKDSVYQIRAFVYSFDSLDASLSLEKTSVMSGFELASIQWHQTQSLQLSPAFGMLLWDRSWKYSLLNEAGFQFWYQLSSSLNQVALDAVKKDVLASCTKLTGGGSVQTSGIFNETLYDSTACKTVVWNDLSNVGTWVRLLSQQQWLQQALFEQWRDGLSTSPVDNNVMDLEPYRDAVQTGWELWYGCRSTNCVLTKTNRTSCVIPTTAFRLWGESEQVSIRTQSGFELWQELLGSIALSSSDAVLPEEIQTIEALRSAISGTASQVTKLQIAQALGLTKWQDWLDYVVLWLVQLLANEFVQRDVLGHWLHATCSLEKNFVQLTLVKDENVSSQVTQCQAAYQVTLDRPIRDLQQSASRPTSYFDPDFMQRSAYTLPTKTVQATEITTICDATNGGFTKIVNTKVSTKTATACNSLSVLSVNSLQTDETALSLARSNNALITPFELNVKDPAMSIELALALWDRHNGWSFTNLTSFLTNWQPSMNDLTKISSVKAGLVALLQVSDTSISNDSLAVVTKYLNDWEMSAVSTTRVASAWVATMSEPILDLSVSIPGVQSGFEVFRSPAWNDRADVKPADAFTLIQSQYLWNPVNAYSFINTNPTGQKLYGLPIGFEAWKEIYDGTDYSSERLVPQFPLVNAFDKKMANESGIRRLTATERDSLLKHMSQDTNLSELQLLIVSQYLFDWSWNIILSDYIAYQWAHGLTPRGQPDALHDLTKSLYRFGIPDTDQAVQVYGNDWFALAKTLVQRTPLQGVSYVSLRHLWNKNTAGSLLYPQSLVVWCAIELFDASLGKTTVCSHLLDEYGQVSSTTLNQLTVALGKTSQPLTQASNVTRLSLEYLSTALEMEVSEILAVATWFRQLPQSSVVFQSIQMQKWLVSGAELSMDPLYLGYELSAVFDADESSAPIPRNVSRAMLIPNTVLNGVESTQCNLSIPTALLLWNSSRDMAFVNPKGYNGWIALATRKQSLSNTVVLTADDALAASLRTKTPFEISCTLQAVANWMASWLVHPWTRQYIEVKWIAAPSSSVSQVLSYDLTEFYGLGSFADSPARAPALTSEETRTCWSLVTRVLWDSTESLSFLHQPIGWPLWRASIASLCSSSDPITFNCSILPSLTGSATPVVALELLSHGLVTRVLALNTTDIGEFNTSIAQQMIQSIIHPWLLQWLDSAALVTFIVSFLGQSEAPTARVQDHAQVLQQLLASQFVNASLSRIHFSSDDPGIASEKFGRKEMVLNPSSRLVEKQDIPAFGGYCELKSYCELGDSDIAFAYDVAPECGLRTVYWLDSAQSSALLRALSDPQPIAWPSINRTSTRSALLINALLSQPFESQEECESKLEPVAQAFGVADSQCGTHDDNTDKFYANMSSFLPATLQVLTSGTTPASIGLLSDLKKYLTYLATKLVYEPEILGLTTTSSMQNEVNTTVFPIGGFLCASTPSKFLFTNPSEDVYKHGFLANNSLDPSRLPTYTFELPETQDATTFRSSATSVGRLVAINNSTTISVAGAPLNLLVMDVTDGSQFTTKISEGKNHSFVPMTLFFFWDFAQRIVRVDLSRQVTRFGLQLLRYNVSDWAAPSTFPNGIESSSAQLPSEVVMHLSLVNVSHVVDNELELWLSNAHFQSGDASVASDGWQEAFLGVTNARQSPIVKLVTTTAHGARDVHHESVLDIDPTTGSVLNRRLVWQLNVPKISSDSIRVWHFNVSSVLLLPLVEINEQSTISPDGANGWLQRMQGGPFASEKVALWQVTGGTIYVFAALVLIAYTAWHKCYRRERERQPVTATVAPMVAPLVPPESTKKSLNSDAPSDDNDASGLRRREEGAKWNAMRAVEETDHL